MKKISILMAILLLFTINTGCVKQEENIKYKTTNYVGTIKEVSETSIIVETDSNDLEFIISENTKIKNSEIPEIGDEINIKCQENTTSNEKIIINATIKKEEKIDYKSDINMLFVNDTLYLESKDIDKSDFSESLTDVSANGFITKMIPSNEVPTENCSSNFTNDATYMIIKDIVYMNINDTITTFIEDNEDIIRYNKKAYYKSDLSEDTVKWLEKYNKMSKEQQLAISFVPPEFAKIETNHDIEVITTNAKTYSQNSGMIELPGEKDIYIQIESVTIGNDIATKLLLYNDSDEAYYLNDSDFSIVGASKTGDAFKPLEIEDLSIFPIKIEAKTLITQTIKLQLTSTDLLEELYIKSDSGMYRISEKNIVRGELS